MHADRAGRQEAAAGSRWLWLLIAVLLLGACGGGQPARPFSATTDECIRALGDPPAPVSGVFVQPDDGYEPVLDELNGARCAIDLTIYMLTDEEVFRALEAAADRGVRVRVMLEEHPYGMFGDQQEAFDRLRAADVAVQWGLSAHRFTHAKYAVIDRRVALVMNQNLTRSAFTDNREFGVITTEPEAVAQAATIFARDWSGISAAGVSGPLVVSPENSRERLLALIGGATRSIDLYAEVISDDEVVAALGDAVRRGATVRLIVNASPDEDEEAELAALAERGVEIRLMDALYVHAKALVIDGERVLIGSQNYTATSLDRNRELGMIVDEPALVARCLAIYERDWARAIPAAPASIPVGLGGPAGAG